MAGGLAFKKNVRMQQFVEHFIRTQSVREAVKLAGYSHKTSASVDRQGQYLMNHPDVKAAIAQAQQEIKAASRVGTEDKRMALWDIAQLHKQGDPEAAIKAIHEMNVMDGDIKGGSGNGAAFSIEQAILMVTQQR
jgi:phage terminase small subunit